MERVEVIYMGTLYSVLIGAFILFLMMLIRRKKYDVSIKKLVAIHFVVTVFTTLGANLGSFLGGMSFLGLRLYGILILDTITMFVLSKLFKMDIGQMGDYLAAPIIAVCCIVKVPCILGGCCYGIELFTNAAGNVVRFPSQIVEFSIWAALTIWLCMIETKGYHMNMLWSIATLWFGIIRFLVDFMRGNPSEMQLVIMGLSGGKFWSLFVAIMGVAYMVYSFKKYMNSSLSMQKLARVAFGLHPIKEKKLEQIIS